MRTFTHDESITGRLHAMCEGCDGPREMGQSRSAESGASSPGQGRCQVSRRPLWPTRLARAFLCVDCGRDTLALSEYYMVRAPVWQAAIRAGSPRDSAGMLCVGCLEARIGRTLRRVDFSEVPVNRWKGRSRRLRARMVAECVQLLLPTWASIRPGRIG